MKSLYEYILLEQRVDEGLIRDAVSLAILRNIDSSKLKTGILSMYEYIVDEDNIEFFYKDYSLKERTLWKNLYKLYQNKIWSIIDIDQKDNNTLTSPELTKVTPEIRRDIRKWIKDSRNSKLDLKPGDIDMYMTITDGDKSYLITINRVSGFFRSMFKASDKKFLEQAFNNLNK